MRRRKGRGEKDGGEGRWSGARGKDEFKDVPTKFAIGCGSHGQSVFSQAVGYFTVPPGAERGGYNTLYRGQASKSAGYWSTRSRLSR